VLDALEREQGDFAVTLAKSGAEFLARLAEKDYDVVLSDFHIAGFEGLQVLDAVRAKNPRVPVVIVTGTGSEEIAVEAMKHGAADYVLKSPKHIQRLPITIHATLEKMQLEEGRIRADEALRESETKYRELVENINDIIFSTDENGVVTFISSVVKAIAEYDPAEIIGRSFAEFIFPEDLPIVTNAFQKAIAGEPQGVECRVLTKSGKLIWARISSRPGTKDDRVIGLRGVITDITERKRAEDEIQNQLARLAGLHTIDRAISASVDLNLTLRIILEQVAQLLHVDAADILLFQPLEQRLKYGSGRGFRSRLIEGAHLRIGESLAGRAVSERRIVSLPELNEVPVEFQDMVAAENFRAYYGAPLVAKGQIKGVLEIHHRAPLHPDSDWLDFFATLAGQAAIAIENAELFQGLQRSNFELALAYDTTLEGWSRAMDLRDKETEGHTQRVTETTIELARALQMRETDLVQVRRGALLHDIGKMGVPDGILLKAGPLTDEEWIAMRKHPMLAYEMLAPIAYLKLALDIPYCHHEKWDGTGYPRGLQGEAIPFAARIFAVVDVWDALRSDRPYRAGWAEEKVLAQIQSLVGTHFDPRVVEAFLKMQSELKG